MVLITGGKKQDITPFNMNYSAHFNDFYKIKVSDQGVKVGDWEGK